MRKLIFILALIFLFVACEKSIEPNANHSAQENPLIITYDKQKEEVVQREWDKFVTYYYTTPDTSLTHFIKSTSFIAQAYFKENLPIIFSDSNNAVIEIELLQFYSEWQDLFGCKENNIELEDINNESRTVIVRFNQKKICGTFYKYIYQPFIKFVLTEHMQLQSIISTLIPNIEIEIHQDSGWVNSSKMIDNTIGLEYEFSIDASSISFPQKHLFSETDTYHVKDGFEIFPKY